MLIYLLDKQKEVIISLYTPENKEFAEEFIISFSDNKLIRINLVKGQITQDTKAVYAIHTDDYNCWVHCINRQQEIIDSAELHGFSNIALTAITAPFFELI